MSNSSWPHAPPHWNYEAGMYFVTGATLRRVHYFQEEERLEHLHDLLLATLDESGWKVKAWAVFSNHYHFIASSTEASRELSKTLGKVHGQSAKFVNGLDKAAGRKVWFNYRETRLTYQRSYLARLNYVIQNPVKHGLVKRAEEYSWCSARWFEEVASRAFHSTVTSFPTDKLKIEDDY